MYQQYKDKVAFYVIYVEEAHASDVWQLPVNVKDDVVYASPASQQERRGVANACVRKLGIEFPALVDDWSNSTERAYTGWPDQLYVIDRDGRVAHKSRPGPWGFPTQKSRTRCADLCCSPSRSPRCLRGYLFRKRTASAGSGPAPAAV